MGYFRIEKSLLRLKVAFFITFLGSGVVTPFLSIFLKNLGLHATEAGIIGGILPFLVFPVRPLIIAISESFNIRKIVLFISFLIFLGSRICFLQVPPNPPHEVVRYNVNRSGLLLSPNSCDVSNIRITDCSKVCNSKNKDEENSTLHLQQAFHCFKNKLSNEQDNTVATFAKSCPVLSADHQIYFVFEPRSVLNLLHFVPVRNISNTKSSENEEYCPEFVSSGVLYKVNSTYVTSTDEICPNVTSLVCSNVGFDRSYNRGQAIYGITFWTSFILFFLSSLGELLTLSSIDAIAYGQLPGTKSSYGVQRLYGSLGYAVSALPAAFLLDSGSGQGGSIDFSIPVYVGSAILLLSGIITVTLNIPSQDKVEKVHKVFWDVLKGPEVIVFFVICAFLGAYHLSVEIFLFWYLKEIGSTQVVMGLAVVARTVGELICLALSGYIIKKIGTIKALYISTLSNLVRFGAYSFLTNPWLVLPIEPLHGLTFCLMWAAASSHASKIAPPEILFTFQSVLSGVIVSAGGGSGVLLTGYLFDTIGPVWTFRYYSIAAGVIFLIYCCLQTLVFTRLQRKYPTKEIDIQSDEAESSVALKSALDTENEKIAT